MMPAAGQTKNECCCVADHVRVFRCHDCLFGQDSEACITQDDAQAIIDEFEPEHGTTRAFKDSSGGCWTFEIDDLQTTDCAEPLDVDMESIDVDCFEVCPERVYEISACAPCNQADFQRALCCEVFEAWDAEPQIGDVLVIPAEGQFSCWQIFNILETSGGECDVVPIKVEDCETCCATGNVHIDEYQPCSCLGPGASVFVERGETIIQFFALGGVCYRRIGSYWDHPDNYTLVTPGTVYESCPECLCEEHCDGDDCEWDTSNCPSSIEVTLLGAQQLTGPETEAASGSAMLATPLVFDGSTFNGGSWSPPDGSSAVGEHSPECNCGNWEPVAWTGVSLVAQVERDACNCVVGVWFTLWGRRWTASNIAPDCSPPHPEDCGPSVVSFQGIMAGPVFVPGHDACPPPMMSGGLLYSAAELDF